MQAYQKSDFEIKYTNDLETALIMLKVVIGKIISQYHLSIVNMLKIQHLIVSTNY